MSVSRVGCSASPLVIAFAGVIRAASRGGGGVVFVFRWSVFNRGGAWFKLIGVVVGSLSCGVRRAYFFVDSPLVRRILQRHVA